MEKLSDMWSGKNILGVEKIWQIGRAVVGDFSPANKHEPVDSSHGTRIIAKEVGVVLLMLLSTMNLAPYAQSKAAISYNNPQNTE